MAALHPPSSGQTYGYSQQGEAPEVQSRQGIVNMAGAAVSLALIVGVCVWGYDLMMRDVSGVPVVRALEGPMRVQPDDPGGVAAAHQGLAVNAVAAEGTAARPADTLTLAPRPVALGEDDLKPAPEAEAEALAAAVAARSDVEAEVSDVLAAVDTVARAVEGEAAGPLDQTAAILALADELAAKAAPLSAPAQSVDAAPEVKLTLADPAAEEVAPELAVARVIPGALPVSLRPILRPASLRRSAPVAAAPQDDDSAAIAAALAEAAAEPTPVTIAPGTFMAQLGALPTEAASEKEWTRLAGRFDEFMGDKTRVIQKAEAGGRSFYRLRAMGFADLSDARRFCSALVAEGAECIPVRAK